MREDGAERRARLDQRRRRTGLRAGPSRAISSRAHSPVRASSRPLVEAFVRSLASSPVSQKAKRSGTNASRAAAARAADPSSAMSWKTVLIGMVWMPVTA